jgi:hypothetical protein
MNTLEAIIYPVVDVIEGTLAPGHEFHKDPQTILFGLDAPLDSVSLLTFITGVEEQAQIVTGRDIKLLTPEVMALEESPFRSLGSLAAYLDDVLERDGGMPTRGNA